MENWVKTISDQLTQYNDRIQEIAEAFDLIIVELREGELSAGYQLIEVDELPVWRLVIEDIERKISEREITLRQNMMPAKGTLEVRDVLVEWILASFNWL